MTHIGGMDEWLARKDALEAKLQPERIRATLAFAGLYQITDELIEDAVEEEVRQFYSRGFDETGFLYDEPRYKAQVRDRHRNKFRASVLWLVDAGAISLAQADRLTEIHKHRNDLTHELAKYLVDLDFEPDVQMFTDALEIRLCCGPTRFDGPGRRTPMPAREPITHPSVA